MLGCQEDVGDGEGHPCSDSISGSFHHHQGTREPQTRGVWTETTDIPQRNTVAEKKKPEPE